MYKDIRESIKTAKVLRCTTNVNDFWKCLSKVVLSESYCFKYKIVINNMYYVYITGFGSCFVYNKDSLIIEGLHMTDNFIMVDVLLELNILN